MYSNILKVVEAAGVGLRKITSCQHLAELRLARARQNRSNRQLEVQIRYTRISRNPGSDASRRQFGLASEERTASGSFMSGQDLFA